MNKQQDTIRPEYQDFKSFQNTIQGAGYADAYDALHRIYYQIPPAKQNTAFDPMLDQLKTLDEKTFKSFMRHLQHCFHTDKAGNGGQHCKEFIQIVNLISESLIKNADQRTRYDAWLILFAPKQQEPSKKPAGRSSSERPPRDHSRETQASAELNMVRVRVKAIVNNFNTELQKYGEIIWSRQQIEVFLEKLKNSFEILRQDVHSRTVSDKLQQNIDSKTKAFRQSIALRQQQAMQKFIQETDTFVKSKTNTTADTSQHVHHYFAERMEVALQTSKTVDTILKTEIDKQLLQAKTKLTDIFKREFSINFGLTRSNQPRKLGTGYVHRTPDNKLVLLNEYAEVIAGNSEKFLEFGTIGPKNLIIGKTQTGLKIIRPEPEQKEHLSKESFAKITCADYIITGELLNNKRAHLIAPTGKILKINLAYDPVAYKYKNGYVYARRPGVSFNPWERICTLECYLEL